MAHRLLTTLVLSSAVLLDGCPLDHERAPVPVDAAMPSDAAMPVDAAMPSDAADPRWCEPGWPTTKGTWRIEQDGLTYVCPIDVDRDDPDLSACCVEPRP